MSLNEFSADPTHGAAVYESVQAGLEEFIKARTTQAAVLRSGGATKSRVYNMEEEEEGMDMHNKLINTFV